MLLFRRHLLCSSSRERPDEIGLALAIRGQVGVEDIVEPDGGLGQDIRALPGIPRIEGLGFAGDESPIDGSNVHLFCDGEDRVEGTAAATGHVLSADDGAVERLEGFDRGLELFGPAVVMKADDVGLCQLNFGDGELLGGIYPISVPDATSQRLSGVGGSRPGEDFGKKGGYEFWLVLWLVEALVVGIVGFIPYIPGEDAVVFGEGSDDAFDVGFEFGLVGGICQFGSAGALNPA